MPSRKARLIFGVLTAVGALAIVVTTLLLAAFDHPFRAVVLLGSGMVLFGILRAAWPGQPWFAARSRWSDGLVYALVGAGILWLSPWTATMAPI